MSAALDTVQSWLDAPNLVLLKEGPGYFEILRELAERGLIVGAKIHDARIAALCLSAGVRELWSADRDFSRFPQLRVRNPL
jgi:predicted nucleic acid-binding protein